MTRKAVILFSGGQDSTTILGDALYQGLDCYTLGFEYGQRHIVELEQASIIADKLEVPFTTINLEALGQIVTTGLTVPNTDLSKPHPRYSNLPASFVPNRNALFLTFAHAYAQEIGAHLVWGGMCETDYSGYPDCREGFIKSLEGTLNLGYQTLIQFVTPLMYLTKGQTFALAEKVGILPLVLEESNTCYNGDREHRHDWGYGCGDCPACKLRAKGWNDFVGIKDAV
jgi:7-cyano-7-deazaguanine synthase